MRRPDDDALLVDILLAARDAQRLTEGVSRDDFMQNEILQLAIEKLVENIGEAASRLSPAARAKIPHIPWHDVVGMRHRLVHDYGNVDLGQVWHVVEVDLDALIASIEPIVPAEE